MSDILTLRQKKELKEILPDFEEKRFIKEAVESKIKTLKGLEFFVISEKIRKGLEKKGYSVKEILQSFKD
jgi:hypothetical protein